MPCWCNDRRTWSSFNKSSFLTSGLHIACVFDTLQNFRKAPSSIYKMLFYCYSNQHIYIYMQPTNSRGLILSWNAWSSTHCSNIFSLTHSPFSAALSSCVFKFGLTCSLLGWIWVLLDRCFESICRLSDPRSFAWVGSLNVWSRMVHGIDCAGGFSAFRCFSWFLWRIRILLFN